MNGQIMKKWDVFGVPGSQEDVDNVNKVLVGSGQLFASFRLVVLYIIICQLIVCVYYALQTNGRANSSAMLISFV